LFLNGDQLGNEALASPVGEHDTVEILTAIAGG
jgi:sulfur carrier protein ThiS